MTTVVFSPIGNQQFFDNDGNPLNGGKLYFYTGGSFTIQRNTWSDNPGTVVNSNPIVLNSAGRSPVDVFLGVTGSYNIVLTNSAGTTIQSWENVTSGGGAGLYSAEFEIETFTANAGQTLFTLGNAYVQGSNDLSVYVNGLRLIEGVDYNETSNTSFTLTAPSLSLGDYVYTAIQAPTDLLNTNYQSYTPTFTASGTAPSLGSGTIAGNSWSLGQLVNYQINFTANATTFGTGTLRFGIPSTANVSQVSGQFVANISGNIYTGASLVSSSANYVTLTRDGSGAVTGTSPATFGTGDTIQISGTYFKS